MSGYFEMLIEKRADEAIAMAERIWTEAKKTKLLKAADDARERVSGYSDEQRTDLEAHARSIK